MIRIILFTFVMLIFWGRALTLAAYFASGQAVVDDRLRRYAERRIVGREN